MSSNWSKDFELWKKVRMNSRVDWKWKEFVSAADDGYLRQSAAYWLKVAVGSYLYDVCMGENRPHTWDKLVSRAKRHGCINELRALRATFMSERLYALKYASESTEEWEFNQTRRGF